VVARLLDWIALGEIMCGGLSGLFVLYSLLQISRAGSQP
jgi:hypothetical protein